MSWEDIIKQKTFDETVRDDLSKVKVRYRGKRMEANIKEDINSIETELEKLFRDLEELEGQDLDETQSEKNLENYNALLYAQLELQTLRSNLKKGTVPN